MRSRPTFPGRSRVATPVAKRLRRIRADAAAQAERRSEELARARSLIVGPEAKRIAVLETEARVSPESVARVLPESIARATEDQPEPLSIALEPSVTSSLHGVVRRDADLFAEILSPSIGAAVRKAVADAFAALLTRLD